MASASALPQDAFAQAFISERPKNTTALLQARLKRSDLIASSLSTYFRERAAIEADYARRLSKLHAKGHIVPDSYGLHKDAGMDTVLKSLEAELNKTARMHDNFGSRLESTVSAALKDSSRAGEAAYKSHEPHANTTAKDLEDAQARLTKAQGKSTFRKGGDMNKLQADIDQIQESWMNEAPAYISAVQRAETMRLESIQQNLAKYETLVSDLARERMELSEASLLKILGWDISADMQTFLLKEGSAGAATFNSSATATVPPTSPRPTSADETGQTNRRGSIMLGSSTAARQSTPSIRSGHSSHHEKKSGGFLSSLRNKRIKPLGGSNNRDDSTTVTGRGRSQSSATETYGPIDEDDIPPVPRQRGQSTPPPASPTVESDEVAETSVLNRPTIQATKGSAGLLSASTGNAGTGNKRESKLPSFLQRKSSNTALFADGSASTGDARLSSEPTTPEPTSTADTDKPDSLPISRPLNGSPQSSSAQNNNPFSQPQASGLGGMLSSRQNSQTPQVDAEGYSIPPPGHDAQPWARSQGSESLMDEPGDMSTSSLPKLDISSTMTPQESEADRQAALQRVQSTLLASGPTRRQTVSRGRRSQPHSMLVTQTPPLPGSSEAAKSPSLTDLSETVSPSKKEPHAIPPSRQQSAMVASPIDFSPPSSPVPSFAVKAPSVISTSASASGANPFEQSGDGGLRVSIVETLSVLAKQGQAPRAQVTGELYLQLGQLQDGVEQFTLRLPEAGSLQRLAPNTQIISSADGGALTVQAKALQEATTSAPVVALRYHVPLPQEQVESLLPLQLSSQWKCEPDLTSLIIQYNSNPSSSFASADSILKDISFAVPVTSPGVAHVKSRPPGMYNADRKRITWRLDDLPLRGDAASQKVLARFQVAEQSSPQPVAVRWSLPGRLISSLSPILDDGPLGQIEEISRRTVSGKYLIQ